MALKRLTLASFAALAFSLASPALANADVVIAAGQHVNEVTILGSDVRVDGTVTGRVTVIDGNLVISPGGGVNDGATVIGGHIEAARGATLGGDVFQIGGSWPQVDGRSIIGLVALLAIVRVLLASVAVRLAMLLSRRFGAVELVQSVRTRPLRTMIVGALVALGVGSLSIVLAITVVGLIISLALWGVLLVAAVAGLGIALAAIEADEPTHRLVTLVIALPLIGDALLAFSMVLGAGSLLHTFGTLTRPSQSHTVRS